MAHAQVRDVSRTTSAPARAPQPSPLPAAAADPQQHPRTPLAFRAVLRHRYCGRLLIGSVTGRLSLGMVPVALILAAQADGHSLARAGVLAALYGIAPALGLPLLGRLADLRGLLLPCCLGAALVAVALGTLAVAGTAHLPLAAGCAVLAGAGCPPHFACCWMKPPGVVHGRWSRIPRLTIRRRSQ
ncbi:MFS transporter, partial [Streptomyces sp. NPDC059805]|uniref:MFS transporter n=1 Tax=Streptomyces sp. NPDC059805 TaxID=3346954 RepID=UPI003646524B